MTASNYMKSLNIKSLLFASGLLVVTLSGLVFLWLHTVNRGEALIEQTKQYAIQSEQEDKWLDLRHLFENTKEDREKINSYFLKSEVDSISFLTAAERTAKEMGLALETKSLTTKDDVENKTKWIEATFDLRGEKPSLLSYLKAMENFPYVVRVMSFDLNNQIGDGWGASMVVRVNLFET